MVMSAVSSVSTPGVLVTVMPRCSAVATSILSTPLPKLAISLQLLARLAEQRGVDPVGDGRHQHVGDLHGLGELGLAHRLVVEVEPRVEQFAHARFDRVRQLARDDDQRLLAFCHFPASRRSAWPSLRHGPHCRIVQASLTAPAETRELPARRRPVPLYQMARAKTKRRHRACGGVQRTIAGLTGVLRRVVAGKSDDRERAGCALRSARCWRAGARPPARPSEPSGTASGLPVPRFVSLKSDRVNVRAGPTKDHDVAWVYNRAALPVEMTAEFENWRRIRDWEGAEGWVYHSLLSGRRTALVSPQSKGKDELLALRDKPDARERRRSPSSQPGVLGDREALQGRLVPPRRRRLRRLDRAGAAVGRLSEREGGLNNKCPAERGIKLQTRMRSARLAQPHHDVDAGDLVALRRGRQLVDASTSAFGMSTSAFSPSTKKWWWSETLVSK